MALPRVIGRELRAAIARAGVRQREVAHAVGISPDRLSKVLSGDRPPKPGELERLADAVVRLSAQERR